MKKLIAATVFSTLILSAEAARLPLRIYSGAKDTVAESTHTIVGVTSPGATATIAGQPAKVYPNTGSFGAKINLKPGLNKVRVAVQKDRLKSDTTLRIYYRDTAVKAKTAASDAPKEITFAEARTVATDSGAYLQYSPSGDRLGGSKMCFLSPDIKLAAIGETGNLYRVRLSANRFAFLPKEYATPVDGDAPEQLHSTGSWSIQRQSRTDRVSIALPARLPYSYWTIDDSPSTVCVEIYGACDNSNWITQRTLDLGIIDRVDFMQVESDVYRVLIRLKSDFVWGYTVGYEGRALCIDVRHKPECDGLRGLHVGLDAGHGGKYPGARSPSGLLEKELNLDIILKLRDMLTAAGARVTLTRDSDTGPSMTERKRILRDAGVDISISVHNNSGGGALASPGTAALYKHSFDRPFALAIARRLVELDVPLFGLVGNFNFSLNGPTDYPNMLVEGLFMSSLEEENRLADPDFRTEMARKIFEGLSDYINMAIPK